MSNKEGSLARAAKAAEADQAATLETMLGLPAEETLGGRTVRVFPVTLGRMKRVGAAMERLGDLGLYALVQDRPELVARLNRILGREAEDPISMEDAAMGMRFMLLQPAEDQVEAMIEIATAVLNGTDPNGDTQTVTREEVEAVMTPPEFLAIYRTAVRISGLNP